MSDATDESTPKTRKSGRERKPVERLSQAKTKSTSSGSKSTLKTGRGKKAAATSEDDDEPEEQADEEEEEDEDEQEDEEDEDFEAIVKKPSQKSATAGKSKGVKGKKSKAGNLEDAEEGAGEDSEEDEEEEQEKRKSKAAKPKKTRVGTQTQRKKKKSVGATDGEDDEEDEDVVPKVVAGGKGDTIVKNDNKIFNAVKNPNAALQSVVDDWVESYDEENPGVAMAELINFVFRTCGCNVVVDSHQAEDDNGIVDTLDEIQEDFKKSAALAYPLISRSKPYKKFRSSLTSFLTLLFNATASSGALYDDYFCQLLQSWLVSLSSSHIRAFRHTATVISLICVHALSGVTVAVNKEFAQASRAKEAEEKKGRKDKARLKDLEKNVEEVHQRKTRLEEYLQELFDSVFVHRYRDSDPAIRTECIKSLGGWMKTHPDFWLEGNYLRYIGWVLSDEHKDVRHESVQALIALYNKDDHIGSMQHFTDRFKGQLVRMATGEIDLSVRVASVLVLRQIDKHGLLEEEQRDQVALLVFEEEKRVRNAVGDFWMGLLEEEVTERERVLEAEVGASKKSGDAGGKKKKGVSDEDEEGKNQARLKLKCLAEMLVKFGKALDGPTEGEEEDNEEEDDNSLLEGIDTLVKIEEAKSHRGRVAFAVEALWTKIDVLRDWRAILEFVLLDHSEGGEEDDNESPKSKGKKKANGAANDEELLEAFKLTEEEETLLVEVLATSIGKNMEAKKEKAKDDADVQIEITRTLIDVLPRLFAKHQIVPIRIVDILSIPCLISLDLYLELRNISAYESLWDDVTKQFMKHTDLRVMDQAVKTVRVLLSTDSLRNANKTKVVELEEAVVEGLREVVDGKDVETSTFDEDELLTLGAGVARINKLYLARNISASLDDTDGGKQSSAWEILDSVSARGRLGYKDEANIVEHALNILFTHLTWRMHILVGASKGEEPDVTETTLIVEARTALLERLEEFSVGTNSNATESVKQVALNLLLQIYTASGSITSVAQDPQGVFADLKLRCSDELQARCAGFVEAEIERFADKMADSEEKAEEEEEEEEESDDSSDEDAPKKKKKAKGKKKATKPAPTGKAKSITASAVRAANAKRIARLLIEDQFNLTIGSFAHAVHTDIINVRHASVILIHWERFGAMYDNWAKLLIQDLRDEALYGTNAEVVSRILVDTLRAGLDLHLDDSAASEERLVSLARQLVNAIVLRGAQLAIAKRIETEYHVQVHLDCSAYAVKKIQTYEANKKKDARDKTLTFFKALAVLLIGLEGKDPQKITKALDASLAAADITVPVTTKSWEPIRAYQKRLATAIAKDPALNTEVKQKGKRAAKKATSDKSSNTDSGEEDEIEDNDREPSPPHTPKAAGRRRGRPPAAKVVAKDNDADSLPARRTAHSKRGAAAVDADSEPEEEEEEVQAKANGASKKRKVEEKGKDAAGEEEANPEEDSEDEEVESLLLSQRSTQSRKRPLSEEPEDDEDQEEDEVLEDGDVPSLPAAGGSGLSQLANARPPVSEAASQASLSDLKKRKRKRTNV